MKYCNYNNFKHESVRPQHFFIIHILTCLLLLLFICFPALEEIIDLLKTPNPDNPLRPEIAKLYVEDRAAHDKQAQEYTRKYAQ